MAVYVALLRGINVGASKRIKMDAFRQVILDLGFADVQTFIQSGNVIFSTETSQLALAGVIEKALLQSFGFAVSVVIRSADELAAIFSRCPFAAEKADSTHVALLTEDFPLSSLDRLTQTASDGEEYHLSDHEIYFYLPYGFHNSKLAQTAQKAAPDATFRNWKTISSLLQIARQSSSH